MNVSVVVLAYNAVEYLRKYLPDVVRFTQGQDVEIVVVDNGSSDGTIAVLTEEFPAVRRVRIEDNCGFAGGYNAGIDAVDAEYTVLLSSDVAVSEGWLDPLIDVMDQNPDVASCQPKIMWDRDRGKFEYAGAAGGYIDMFGYPFCRGRIFDQLEEDQGQYNDPVDLLWSSGACMIIRTSLYKEFGGLDPDFHLHMEEIDLCWRMKNRGHRIAYTPKSCVYHYGGGTVAYNSPAKIYYNFRNNWALLYKNLPGKMIVPVFAVRGGLDLLAVLKFLPQPKLAGAVLRAMIDFMRGLPALHKKRRALSGGVVKVKHAEIYKGSIVWDYFMRKRRRFSELSFSGR